MTRAPEIPRIDAVSGLHDDQRGSAENRLRHYEAIVNASGDAILGCTFDGVVEVANPAAERFFGLGAPELIGRPVERLLPAAVLDSIADGRRAVREGQPRLARSVAAPAGRRAHRRRRDPLTAAR